MTEGSLSKGAIVGVVIIVIIVIIGGVFAYQRYFQKDDENNGPPPITENIPPTAIIITNWTSETRVNDVIEFNATKSYDDDGYIILYSWDFQPGPKYSGSNYEVINHSFSSAGTYTVNLSVRDNDGGNGYATRQIVIRQADVNFDDNGAISTNDILPLEDNVTFNFPVEENVLRVNFSLTFAGGSGDIDQSLNSRCEIQVYDPIFRLMETRNFTVRGFKNQTFEYSSYELPLAGNYQVEVFCRFGTVTVQFEGTTYY